MRERDDIRAIRWQNFRMKLIFAAVLIALSSGASASNLFTFWKKERVSMGNFSVTNCHFKRFSTVLTISVSWPNNCPAWIDVKPDMTYETPSWFNRSVIVPTP